jgi:hypothetical protein
MGLKPSPYASVKGALRAKQKMLGNRHDSGNPFQWEKVQLNMPGSDDYDPKIPWIAKVMKDGRLAADIHQYVDDLRLTAPDKELAWRVSSRVAKMCIWLELQDAARKRREPSQTPGAWAWLGHYAGCGVPSSEVDFGLEKELKIGKPPPGKINHKIAETYRGFLVYVSRTYRAMVPYLKGLHLTLDRWRPDRDEDGWRLSNTMDRRLEFEE